MRDVPEGARSWVYAGESPLWAIEAERSALAGLPRVPMEEALHQRAAELREPYLDWIAELGVRNDSLDWWASELAAKNVYTFLFQRLCAAGAVADLLEDGLLVVCATPAMAATIARLARARGLDARVRTARDRRSGAEEIAHRVLHGVPRRRAPMSGIAAGATLLATWVDDRSFDERGRYRDPHFGALPGMLRDSGECVGLLARLLPAAGRRETVRRLVDSGEPFCMPDSFLTAADWRECARRARRFDPAIEDDAQVGGVPSASLARELVRSQRISHTGALTYERLLARMAAAGLAPGRIVIAWEGHAWETALIWAAARHLPDTPVVGYDNVNFSTFALSLYPGAAEVGVRPLPDRVVTNGPAFAGVLARSAFPEERIRVGCALRHGYLYEAGELRAPAPREPAFVLGAGSIDAGQTAEMVSVAHEAFGEDLLVKLHPSCDAAAVRRALAADVRFSEQPIGELLPRARAMIYTYSIVPYEALAAGVPPIFFRSQSLLDLDQLEPAPDVRWTAATAEELRAVLGEADAASGTAAWRERARAVVIEALAPASAACVDAFLGG